MAVTGSTRTNEVDAAIPAMISAAAEQTASDLRVFRPLITEHPFTGPGDTLDLLTVDAVSAATYTQNTTRTFTTGDPTAVTLTPYEIDVAMSFTDKALKRSLLPLVPTYSIEIGRAVAVKMDADVAVEYANFTGTSVDEGDAAPSIAKLLTAIGAVRVAGKDQLGAISAVLHTSAWDDLISDDKVINAQARGNGQALFGGSFELVGGGSVSFTTAINSAGSPAKYQNMVFTRRAIALAWKSLFETEVWRDADEKQVKIGAGADYDVAMRFAGEGSVYTVTV